MVDETPPVIETPYVRIATLEDVEGIVDVMCQAFKHDPVLNYLSNAPKLLDETSDPKHHNHRRIFLRFLLKASFLVDGRITVVVDPNASSANEGAPRERIVAAAYWLPPNKRLAVWMIPTIVRAGALAVVKVWGLKPSEKRFCSHLRRAVEICAVLPRRPRQTCSDQLPPFRKILTCAELVFRLDPDIPALLCVELCTPVLSERVQICVLLS